MYNKILFSSLFSLNVTAFSLGSFAPLQDALSRSICQANSIDLKSDLGRSDRSLGDYLQFEVTDSRLLSRFTPLDRDGKPMDLEELAIVLGYQDFNWVSYVEADPYGIKDYRGKEMVVPYGDPPPGGYQYDAADVHPFYWDVEQCQNCHSRHHHRHPLVRQKHALVFEDSPTDYRLQPGETVDFVTYLVGVKEGRDKSRGFSWDVLTGFRWQLTNTREGKSKISLNETNIDSNSFASELRSQIAQDGGSFSNSVLANTSKNSLHNHQCQLQSRQSQHLADYL